MFIAMWLAQGITSKGFYQYIDIKKKYCGMKVKKCYN